MTCGVIVTEHGSSPGLGSVRAALQSFPRTRSMQSSSTLQPTHVSVTELHSSMHLRMSTLQLPNPSQKPVPSQKFPFTLHGVPARRGSFPHDVPSHAGCMHESVSSTGQSMHSSPQQSEFSLQVLTLAHRSPRHSPRAHRAGFVTSASQTLGSQELLGTHPASVQTNPRPQPVELQTPSLQAYLLQGSPRSQSSALAHRITEASISGPRPV